MDPASLEVIRAAWRQVLRAPAAFREPDATAAVVVSRPTGPGEPSWLTVVSLGESTCVVASADVAPRLDPATAAGLTEPDAARAALGTGLRVAGPAVLAFADRATFRAPSGGRGAVPAPAGEATLARLAAACDQADVEESGFRSWRRWRHVVEVGDQVAAGAGAEVWAGTLAHVGVLTRPEQRGRGHARAAAGATVTQALDAGMVAQWRARAGLAASRRVAGSLGFVELGSQVTYSIAEADHAADPRAPAGPGPPPARP